MLGIEPEIRTRLLEPHRALIVNFPVRSDSGAVSSFTGYRVQHTLAMGPVKGGVRYGPGVSLGECAALAMWMTFKLEERLHRADRQVAPADEPLVVLLRRAQRIRERAR